MIHQNFAAHFTCPNETARTVCVRMNMKKTRTKKFFCVNKLERKVEEKDATTYVCSGHAYIKRTEVIVTVLWNESALSQRQCRAAQCIYIIAFFLNQMSKNVLRLLCSNKATYLDFCT